MDMRFFWVRDRVQQNHFNINWKKGAVNRADYFTKHHSAAHHQRTRPLYVSESSSTVNSILHFNMRGCVHPITPVSKLTTYVRNVLRRASKI